MSCAFPMQPALPLERRLRHPGPVRLPDRTWPSRRSPARPAHHKTPRHAVALMAPPQLACRVDGAQTDLAGQHTETVAACAMHEVRLRGSGDAPLHAPPVANGKTGRSLSYRPAEVMTSPSAACGTVFLFCLRAAAPPTPRADTCAHKSKLMRSGITPATRPGLHGSMEGKDLTDSCDISPPAEAFVDPIEPKDTALEAVDTGQAWLPQRALR